MTELLLRRTLESLLSLCCLIAAVFVAVRLTGDPAKLYLPLDATEEMRAAFRAQYGFDQPILVQFAQYLGDLARLDFGESLRRQEPALGVVLEAYPTTLKLAAVTIALSLLAGIVIGCLSALKPGSVFDRSATTFAVSGASLPDFWLALMGILIFAVTLRWLPTSGIGGVWHWILPVAVLMTGPTGRITQVVRGSMVDALSSAYIDAARGRGIGTARILFVHALRNAAIPAITVVGVQAANIVNGAVVVETIFGWPGIGRLMIEAVLSRDFAVVQTAVIVIAVVIFAMNLATDVIYGIVDPRVRKRA